MTIEEVSVLFDTGRKGNAQAATLALAENPKRVEDIEDDDAELRAKADATTHIEAVGNK